MGELGTNFIVVFNDNDMSIAENHGGMYKGIKKLRETNGQQRTICSVPSGWTTVSWPTAMMWKLIRAFEEVRDIDHPVVVHIVTQKGKGYAPAEQHKEAWHYCAPFHPETGEPLMDTSGECYESITLDFMMKKMQADPSVCMITSGTPTVLGFTEEMRKKAGRQFIDVGIARRTQLRWRPALRQTAASRSTACTARSFSALMTRFRRTCASTATQLPLLLRGVRFTA